MRLFARRLRAKDYLEHIIHELVIHVEELCGDHVAVKIMQDIFSEIG